MTSKLWDLRPLQSIYPTDFQSHVTMRLLIRWHFTHKPRWKKKDANWGLHCFLSKPWNADLYNCFSYIRGTKPKPASTVFAIIDPAKTIERTGFGLVATSISSMILFQLLYAILWPCKKPPYQEPTTFASECTCHQNELPLCISSSSSLLIGTVGWAENSANLKMMH